VKELVIFGAATSVAENKDANFWHTSTEVEAPKTKISYFF